jgi:TfoX/Sxy family transcriptional regulator of competence genes
MSYDKRLAERIDQIIEGLTFGDYAARKMFGGIGYMVKRNMACGILVDSLIVRVGEEAYEHALEQAGVSEFLNNGRPMTGWVMVEKSVLGNDQVLKEWIGQGVAFALSLPVK